MDYFFTHRDDFEYVTADIPSHYDFVNGAVVTEAGKGRAGSKALRFDNTNQYVAISIPGGNSGDIKATMVITPPSSGSFLGSWRIITLVKSTFAGPGFPSEGTVVFSLKLRTDLALEVRGVSDALQGIVHGLLQGGVEQHLEVQWSVGQADIYVNERLVYSDSGTFGNSSDDAEYTLQFGTLSFNEATTAVYYDDMHIVVGSPIGAQIGDNDYEQILATANGATNDYVANGGPDHWEVVDVLVPDDSTLEYDESSTPGDISLYQFDIPAYPRLLGLRMLHTTKEFGTDASLDYRGTLRYGGGPTIVNGSTKTVAGSYTMFTDDISPVPTVAGTTIEAGPELISFTP